ncbi:MAG: ABC transporter ATP-binding protein [Erysipelotrichaceae bacterium]|jgi:multiple sugar transport system ATP-binding protein|nr:ABC transporter ATP-binding protein [Erysipelotrichaceae bacterium]
MQIHVENLTKRYGKTIAVNDFSATFEEGKLIALLGPSGCGKSTMLYMLAGIAPVTSGKILFDGTDVTYLPPEKRNVGLVFQNYALYPHMSVLANICFPLEIAKVTKKERLERAGELAKLVHIEDLMDRKPNQLSGGQQQRVAIARALAKRPSFLLLDEPLSNLDARLRLEMREEIRRIQKDTGVTTIFVTHDQEEAMSISDSVILMKDGVLQQYASPQELYDEPINSFAADFLGNPPINKISGTIDKGKFIPEGTELAIDVLKADQSEGTHVTLALRAESLMVNHKSPKSFPALVDNLFVMGKEEIVALRIGDTLLRGYIDASHKIKIGDEVPVSLRSRGVFLFDSHSGVRLQ